MDDLFADFTPAELDDIRASALAEIRKDELAAAIAATTNSFDAYWAGSASSSILRDYKAGRVVNV